MKKTVAERFIEKRAQTIYPGSLLIEELQNLQGDAEVAAAYVDSAKEYQGIIPIGTTEALRGARRAITALLEALRPEDSLEREAQKIPGGLAEGKKSSDFDPAALARGIKVELEHTSDPKVAKEIAMDHLTEDPKYYEKLATIEGK